MKGWRTVIFNVVMPILQFAGSLKYGSPEVSGILSAVWAIGNIALRAITNTPIGQDTPA